MTSDFNVPLSDVTGQLGEVTKEQCPIEMHKIMCMFVFASQLIRKVWSSWHWRKTALKEATVHSWNTSLHMFKGVKEKTHPPGICDGVAVALSSALISSMEVQSGPQLWERAARLNRTEPKQSPVDSRCWSRDLLASIPACQTLPPPARSVHALFPPTPSGAICPAALCSNGGVSETLQALIDDSSTTPQ